MTEPPRDAISHPAYPRAPTAYTRIYDIFKTFYGRVTSYNCSASQNIHWENSAESLLVHWNVIAVIVIYVYRRKKFDYTTVCSCDAERDFIHI